jgi:hypothetical protein
VSRCRHPSIVREAVAAIADGGGQGVDIDLNGGGHVKITWIKDGRRHLFAVAKSPSDRRAGANARAALRRLLREEGRP